ncbi:hypothetical protein [Listeria monocytogenes]|nr:hypothetical protein [Listeria monocytogenes]
MLKIKKQAQSIYAFKETGGEVLNFQIEKNCLETFFWGKKFYVK